LLTAKGLTSDSEGVVEADIGNVSIATLASALMADDWERQGSLMRLYWDMLRASDLEIGPWASGRGAAAKVQGSVRSVQMRIPLPRQMMCPEETRCTSIWHVLVTPSKVVLESATMCFDVPYGDYYNVVLCDTFSLDITTGRMRMVRTCGVEWLKTTWVKGTVERNVWSSAEERGRQWAEQVALWMQQGVAEDREIDSAQLTTTREAFPPTSGSSTQLWEEVGHTP